MHSEFFPEGVISADNIAAFARAEMGEKTHSSPFVLAFPLQKAKVLFPFAMSKRRGGNAVFYFGPESKELTFILPRKILALGAEWCHYSRDINQAALLTVSRCIRPRYPHSAILAATPWIHYRPCLLRRRKYVRRSSGNRPSRHSYWKRSAI